MLRLVGDLGREEELGLLLRRRQGEGEKLDGDPVLGDEELGEAKGQELALLLGEHVRIGPLAGVLGEVEVLGRPVLPLPAREQLLVARRGFDDSVEAGHDLVDVAVEQDAERLVLRVQLAVSVRPTPV